MKHLVVNYMADNGGCAHYRIKFPSLVLGAIHNNVFAIDSIKYVMHPDYYNNVKMIRIQRHVSHDQCNFILKFLKPICDSRGIWLSYELDDVIGREDIPKYNIGWNVYQDDSLMKNVETVLKVCDVVTVTTPQLRDYLSKRFNAPKEKFLVIPNYLPMWWIRAYYNETKSRNKIKRILSGQKPKMGVISSSSHYDLKKQNNCVDDFTHVIDYIRDTVDKFEWIFMGGGLPEQLRDLNANGKIKFIKQIDILNYPGYVDSLDLDTVFFPLQNNIFNKCKSNIKMLECAAWGVLPLAQDIEPYEKCNTKFSSLNQLSNIVDDCFSSEDKYMDHIKRNHEYLMHDNLNGNKGWWLENNADKWMKVYAINQRTIHFDIRKIDKDKLFDKTPTTVFEV